MLSYSVTYQRLISRFCQDGDIDGATKILEFMREKQLPVNENVFNALIMGHSNADDLESAVGILGVMGQAGLEPSADTYTTLLCGYARKGDIASINKYIEECESKEVHLMDKDYLEVVYALTVNGHGDKVDEVLSRVKKGFGYNHDAVNTILRLINRGHEDVALKILKTMPRGTRYNGEQSDTGNFLIKQLIRSNRPAEQVLNICRELEESELNTKPIMIAVEAALTNGNVDLSKALLKEMQTKGLPIRQHYFWPIICASKTENEVFDTFKMMQEQFNVYPNQQTIRDYVIPQLLKTNDLDRVFIKLRSLGISIASAAATTAYTALLKHDISKAAEILSSYETYISPGLFGKPLMLALDRSKDYDSYVKILRQLHDNLPRARTTNQSQKQEIEEDGENEEQITEVAATSGKSIKTLQADVIGDLITDVTFYFKSDRVEVLQNVLQRLVDQGISISSNKAEFIQEKLGENLTTELSTLLGKLTSGELEPIELENQRSSRTYSNQMDTGTIERLISRMEEKGENTKGLKRQLLVAAIRSRNIEKSEEIIEKLKAEGFILTSGVYAQLIDLYASADKLDQAIETLKTIRKTDPEFVLDEVKLVKIAQAFLNADRVDEAVKFLEENQLKEIPNEKKFSYQTTCWRLLNSLAEKGKAPEVQKVFDALVANNYVVPNNVLFGPLIKVHLVQNDLKLAIDKFEEICQKYRVTPWKNEIASRLIQAEDAITLQRVTDLSSEIHGEVNSLYDLVFCFIECGRIRQARKILETPGMHARSGRINIACERYLNENMFTALEGLVEATKDLTHIDRAEIYYSLLQTYIKESAADKALNLWTTMQEEAITPSDAFLFKLAEFLKSEDREVPFHVPDIEPVNVKETKETQKSRAGRITERKEETKARSDDSPNVTALKSALKSKNVDAVLKASAALEPSDKASLHDRSAVIEFLVQNERLNDATNLVFKLLDEKLYPIPKVFRFYLNKLAHSGDSETIKKIGSFLSSETKKKVSFDNKLCHSYIESGKADEYLKALEDTIDNAKTPEDFQTLGEEFPRGAASGILKENPDRVGRFEKIAKKYAAAKVIGPMNVLWMHLFIEQDPKADAIFNEHLLDEPRLMFQRIVKEGREKQDAELVEKLIGILHKTKVSEGAKGNVYSCLIDIYATKNDPDGCIKAIDASIKDVCLENINKTALFRAKACVESAGQKFPHQIPAKNTTKDQDSSSSSSSSSSDDEVTQKKKSN